MNPPPGKLRPPASELRHLILGPAVMLAAVIILWLLTPISPNLPNRAGVLVLVVVFAASYGGLAPGLISAGIGWLFVLASFLARTLFPGMEDGGLGLVISSAVGLPLAAWIVGKLQEVSRARIEAAVRAEQQQATRLAQSLAERERAQQSLEDSRSMWESVWSAARDMIYVKDTEGRYVMANQAWLADLPANSGDDLIGKTDADIFPPQFARLYQAEDRQVLETGEPLVNSESPSQGPDGTEQWVLTSKVPWRDMHGNIVGVVGISRDITERKRTESALRDAEARYRGLVERLPAIVYVVEMGPPNTTIYISPQVEALLGISPAEYLSDPGTWKALLHPEDRDWVIDEIERVDAVEAPLDIECRMVARDGRVVWVRNQAARLPMLNGNRRYVQGIMLDITAYKLAEKAWRESEQRYQLVTWATNDAVWDWNLATDTVWFNEGLQKLFQHVVVDEAWPYARWADQVHPADRLRVRASLERALQGDDNFWSKEYRFRRADGTYADVFDRGYLLRDLDGKPTRMVGAMVDVSERKRVEAALREAEGNYRSLVEQLPAVVYVAEFGEAGQWHYVSPQIQPLLGFTPQEWLADSGLWARQMHPDDRARILQNELDDMGAAGGTVGVIEYRMLARDGRTVWVRDSAVILPQQGNGPRIYHGVLTDITEQKRAQEALQEANQILTQWLQHSERRTMELGLLNELSSLMQNCHNVNEACLSAQPILRRLFAEEQLGLYIIAATANPALAERAWADRALPATPFDPDDCWAFRRKQIYVVDSEHPGPLCRHLGEAAPEAYMCVPITVQGRPRALLHVRAAPAADGRRAAAPPTISDSQHQLARTVADSMGLAFANLELRESLREQSIRDALTGLYNRRYMEESLEREISRAERHVRTVSLVMLDIDHFKDFNDAHGHPAGDAILRDLGRILRQHIRGADIACRYGGEEFILILPEASLAATHQRAEQLRAEAARLQPELAGHTLKPITVSMGVASYPQHGATAEALLHAADLALYQAKREGRNRVHVHP
jgi:diguanylate cyclase (GGDEF)-like protein/PAS domain S-box-containing protein